MVKGTGPSASWSRLEPPQARQALPGKRRGTEAGGCGCLPGVPARGREGQRLSSAAAPGACTGGSQPGAHSGTRVPACRDPGRPAPRRASSRQPPAPAGSQRRTAAAAAAEARGAVSGLGSGVLLWRIRGDPFKSEQGSGSESGPGDRVRVRCRGPGRGPGVGPAPVRAPRRRHAPQLAAGPGGGEAPLRANKGRDPGVRSRGRGAALPASCLLCPSGAHNVRTKAD